MTNDMIHFAVWSPSEELFWNSWKQAGIVTAPFEFTPEYPGITISDQTRQGWIPKSKTGEIIPGWHANVRINGPLVQQFTYGLQQYDEQGNLLNLFDRTWAAEVFSLTQKEADPVTNFPAGYRNTDGITYGDVRDIKTPSNVWA